MESNIAIVAAVLGYLCFLATVMFHETGHALMAMLLGRREAYPAGGICWNPLTHMRRSRFGLAIMPLISLCANTGIGGVWTFGYPAAPFEAEWAVKNRRDAALISFGGPAANMVVMLASAFLIKYGVASGVFAYDYSGTHWLLVKAATPGADTAAVLLSILFYQNILMAVFNLMPLPPLDGFSLAAFWMKEETALKLYQWEAKLSFLYPLGVFHATAVFWAVMSRAYLLSLAALF